MKSLRKISPEFGRYLERYRKKKGISISSLVMKSETLSDYDYYRIEHGYIHLPETKLYEIANAYEIPIKKFLKLYLKYVYDFIIKEDEIPDSWEGYVRNKRFHIIRNRIFDIESNIHDRFVIKRLLRHKGKTIKELAKCCNVYYKTACSWINGDYNPSFRNMIKICECLKITPSMLLDYKEIEVYSYVKIKWNKNKVKKLIVNRNLDINELRRKVLIFDVNSLFTDNPRLKVSTLVSLCDFFDVEPDYFFSIKKIKKRSIDL